jgi:erythritol kinase
MDLLIGIDAGTSVIKAVAFDLKGQQIAVTAKPNQYETLPNKRVEQDLERTWTDTLEVIQQLVEKLEGHSVIGLAVTGQGSGTWLIDAKGDPVGKSLLWLDARAAGLVEKFGNTAGARRRFELTGTGLAAADQGPQICWMKAHQPEMLSQSTTAFHCKDWLYFRLTGERATDPSECVFTCGDFRKRDYSEEVIELLGLNEEKSLFPEVVDGAKASHPLNESIAKLCGLTPGLPVVLGYVDVICTALGSGLYDPGYQTGCTIIGSTGMHMRLVNSVEEVELNDESTGYTMVFPVEGTYSQMQSNMAATLNIDWMLDLAIDVLRFQGINKSRVELLKDLDKHILDAPPAEILYHPYISHAGERGPFINANARASFLGLSSKHGYFEMLRSVYEGLSFAARDCYEAAGGVPEEVRLSGGAARSTALRKIMGAVLKTRFRTAERGEAGASGAAMMAAVNLGIYPSMATCLKDWVHPYLSEIEEYDATQAKVYDKLYPTYLEARKAYAPFWKSLNNQGE